MLPPEPKPNATLELNSYAGRHSVPCRVLDETKHRARVLLLADCLLPGARIGMKGAIHAVPKRALTRLPNAA